MSGPVALITGGNRGLGYQIARRLSALEFTVVLTARRREAGDSAAAALSTGPRRVEACRLDVLDKISICETCEFIRHRYGRLDVLVNNAGAHANGDGPGLTLEPSVLRDAIESNCVGALQVTQAMAPLLKTAAGRVINISSLLALPAQMSQLPGQFFGYRIAKAALNAVTAGLAEELRPQGVSVNAVHPGWLKTSMGGPHAPEEATAGADRVRTARWRGVTPVLSRALGSAPMERR